MWLWLWMLGVIKLLDVVIGANHGCDVVADNSKADNNKHIVYLGD